MRIGTLSILTWISSLAVLPVAPALGATGGASADTAPGGPHDFGALAYGAPTPQKPVARTFHVAPGTVVEGGALKLKVRVVERGVERVSARIVAIERGTNRVGARFSLGTIRTGRTLTLAWPAAQMPTAGRYTVRLHVRDPQGATLARVARATGKATLIVRPRPRPENSQTEPQAQPTQTVSAGGIFPVAGAYTFGGEDARFGAARDGHTHEGQDIAAAEGTPVLSPVPGVVAYTDEQRKGAGLYVVLNADDGRSMFFAHCQEGSVAVAPGQRVIAGTQLCRVGTTGSSTGPHLHFELWIGGWRDRGGTPVDPLPQLKAWAGV